MTASKCVTGTVANTENLDKTAYGQFDLVPNHYENTPFQIYRKNSPPKTENVQIKTQIFFHISAQNIDCGYSLEPPR